jgi:hypothetical protein
MKSVSRQRRVTARCSVFFIPFFIFSSLLHWTLGAGEWVLPVCREDFGMRVFWMRGAASEIRKSFALALASILQV